MTSTSTTTPQAGDGPILERGVRPRVPAPPFAVFDEFGLGADDRVQDYAAALVAAERERGRIEDGQGDRIDALLLRAKDVVARSDRPKDCGGTYAVPAAEWLALQEEVMHRLREHASEACGA